MKTTVYTCDCKGCNESKSAEDIYSIDMHLQYKLPETGYSRSVRVTKDICSKCLSKYGIEVPIESTEDESIIDKESKIEKQLKDLMLNILEDLDVSFIE